jgi:hypothetical protein
MDEPRSTTHTRTPRVCHRKAARVGGVLRVSEAFEPALIARNRGAMERGAGVPCMRCGRQVCHQATRLAKRGHQARPPTTTMAIATQALIDRWHDLAHEPAVRRYETTSAAVLNKWTSISAPRTDSALQLRQDWPGRPIGGAAVLNLRARS